MTDTLSFPPLMLGPAVPVPRDVLFCLVLAVLVLAGTVLVLWRGGNA